MIDVENEVFTRIAEMLRCQFAKISAAGEYVKTPSSFPHVSIMQSDCYPVSDRQDSSLRENMSAVLFEINVYSNKTNGKKAECKRIIQAIDELLYSMNFKRLALTPVPNMEDATIYRMTARYRAETDGKYFYRR